MILDYETEYRVGRWVRARRRHAGVRALVAILLELGVALAFGAVALVLRLARLVLVTASRAIVVLLALPFRVARAISHACQRRAVAKPAWALAEEL
jgi:hypothetical protein